jgi:hypothetical protein
MWCLDTLKLAISLNCTTTSGLIHQELAMLFYISEKYLEKVIVFALLCLGSKFLPNDVYRDVRYRPIQSQKYEYGGSLHPI